ncbi:hypothetical protein K7X08_021540 [Anisodus acutangulus]|uniref:Uncharacterized protein n=1 Tax=Anisodus acutangulus TaxID=402998 RepID=A0A9Q1M5L7_9SOLA|nr:hypothetical protein K7X08_021540 [Anisodus acutangulus]
MQPKLKSPTYRQVHEKPPHTYQAYLSRDETERRYDELVDYENRYEAARTGVNHSYEYDGGRSVQGHNLNKYRGGVHHHGLDRCKLLALEDGSSRGDGSFPFDSQFALKYAETARSPLSAHVQPRLIRLRDEVSCYPVPFLLEKLTMIERLEREERFILHPNDVSLYMESVSRSKDIVASSQYKECSNTSSGTSRMNYAPMIEDDMDFLGDIHSRSSTKLRQSLYLNEYGENHNYNTLEDYAARHKKLRSYQYDKVSSSRGDNMDYVYPKGKPRYTSDYGHSYERTSFLEQAVLDKRHAQAQILLEPHRENLNDTEFPQRDVINNSSCNYHSLEKQPVSMRNLQILLRYSKAQARSYEKVQCYGDTVPPRYND